MTETNDPRRAALEYLFTGDALSMPVHWYYRPSDIWRQFPPAGITRMEAAPEQHPSSIMSLHSTRQGGRSTKFGFGFGKSAPSREIVGEVILKGRRHLWGDNGRHYHHGMPAGENTLNTWCARWLLEHLTELGAYTGEAWINRYVEQMKADPPAHPDTYAESYHRGFFANLEAGKSPLQCGAVTHDTPSMGALVTVAPIALALFPSQSLQEVQALCREHVWLTHPDELLMQVVDAYVLLMKTLLELPVRGPDGEPAAQRADRDALVRAALVTAATAIKGTRLDKLLDKAPSDAAVVGGQYSLACYITDSWPSVCWLAARHWQTPGKALKINSNLGGENAHRGSVLGTLVGLASCRGDAELFSQLNRHDEIAVVLDEWEARFPMSGES